MKIGNLKHGQTLKNIKELCEVLKIPYKDSTDSRKAIFKDLEKNCNRWNIPKGATKSG